MINRDELQAKTVTELRNYAAAEGIRFNTKVRKAEMIERLLEISPALVEASKEEAEATATVTKEGVKVVRKATLDIYSPEDLRGMPKAQLADIARARAGKGGYSRMNKEQLIQVINANPVLGRYAKDATEEELEALGKLAAKVSKEVRAAKEPKAPKGAKAEKFLPAAPEPKMLPLAKKAEESKPAKAEKAPEPKKETSTKSDEKAATFMKNIADDWTTEVTSREGEKTEVTAQRGDESIKIHWLQGVFHNGNGIYTDPLGRTIVMRNASACIKQSEVSEEVALQKAQAKQAGKRTAKGSGMGRPKNAPKAEEVPQEKLPFDPEESTAKEIIAAVEGKKITWVNSISGKVQSAQVRPHKNNKILPGTAKSPSPIIQFMTEAGDCSVRISSIKSVK